MFKIKTQTHKYHIRYRKVLVEKKKIRNYSRKVVQDYQQPVANSGKQYFAVIAGFLADPFLFLNFQP